MYTYNYIYIYNMCIVYVYGAVIKKKNHHQTERDFGVAGRKEKLGGTGCRKGWRKGMAWKVSSQKMEIQ